MSRFSTRQVLLVLALSGACVTAAAQTTYRWVDENGVVHYGDRIPPEYADQPSDMLNRHGVPVGSRSGAVTEAQLEAERVEAAARAERIEQQRRDRVLLDTYLSVDEIRMLRDRRLQLLDAQLAVTESTLQRLYQQLHELEVLASEFQPYSQDPEADRVPEDLADDLASAQASVIHHERRLARGREEQATMIERFDQDIERFQELQAQRRPQER
jgi:hypothetical protein